MHLIDFIVRIFSQKAAVYFVDATGTKSKIYMEAKESQLRLWIRNINSLKPSGNFCPSKFNIQRFYISRKVHWYILCGTQNSDYFPVQR